MKILVISDTHGDTGSASRLIRTLHPDHLLHLGDCVRDAEDLEREFPQLPICAVTGNNDWFSREEKEKVIELNGIRIFLCHGHTTGVRDTLYTQINRAREYGCRVSLFGHTHSPLLEDENGILLLNPGSLTFSRTYALLYTEDGKEPRAELKDDG